ncbi:MAG: RagB/SusD family nutrient uptake outer membrane protein [Bacteroidales bacterium]|jgi:hypothetical protein|nr:RagB/SusD family nutrient uptake outer membrane protein [Bacteroidales bacterium]
MKTKLLSLILSAAVVSGICSCNDYLDMTPTDSVSDKLVWSNETYADMAVNYFYGDIPYFGSFGTGQCYAGMTEGLTDEFKYGSTTYNSFMYIPNEISYGGSVLAASYVDVYMGNWGTLYDEIRRVNEALSNLKKYGGSLGEKAGIRLTAELRFFRGMYYFELIKKYKQVIIYDEDLSKMNTNMALSTEDQGWDFVEADLEAAGKDLKISTAPNGRITSGAAYALLSRAMLYAKRWDVVKSAAEKVFDMGYLLTADYSDSWKAGSSEAILQYSYDATSSVTHDFDSYYSPAGDKKYDGMLTTGGYGTPTQDMVESYELASGGYPDWSDWHMTTGTNDTPPYDKLEPRFAATVLYNGSSWKGRTIEPYSGGDDGWATWLTDANPEGKTTTGYYLRKLVDEAHNFATRQSSTQPWTAIRLAEVYLNYAEACHELKDDKTARTYIDKVRTRVGLPTVGSVSGDDLMAALRHERKVELAYEGLYYWDMRRWGLSESAFTGIRRHGLKITKNDDGSFTYSYVEVDRQNLNFPSKMYGCPLPQSELENNALVNQFKEWN